MPQNLRLSELWIYPIKSLGGISLTSATLTERGLAHDRRWMLVDETGRFLSQRTFPEMALLRVELTDDALVVRHKTRPVDPLVIPLASSSTNTVDVQVWDDTMPGQTGFSDADAWFTEVLSRPCRLIYQPEATRRPVDPRYAHHHEITSFSDGFPFLLIGQSSLDDLNSRLETPLPMLRFRPNMVFTGGPAFDEDAWHSFQIGSQAFFAVKPCARCVMTTIDPETAEKGKEPLRTLARYRNWNSKILFGQNILPGPELGRISVGDEVVVHTRKNPPL
jgi:uncharacterized protein YcbX